MTLPRTGASASDHKPAPPHTKAQLLDFTPVPVRTRTDGWTPEKQRALIAAIACHATIRAACRAVEMAHENAYRLRLRDGAEEFCRAWDLAAEHGEMVLEDIAYDRAVYGTEEPVMHKGEQVTTRTVHDNRLLMFLLAAQNPDKYCARARSGYSNALRKDSPAYIKMRLEWGKEMAAQIKAKAEAAKEDSNNKVDRLALKLRNMRDNMITGYDRKVQRGEIPPFNPRGRSLNECLVHEAMICGDWDGSGNMEEVVDRHMGPPVPKDPNETGEKFNPFPPGYDYKRTFPGTPKMPDGVEDETG